MFKLRSCVSGTRKLFKSMLIDKMTRSSIACTIGEEEWPAAKLGVCMLDRKVNFMIHVCLSVLECLGAVLVSSLDGSSSWLTSQH